jgi:hypothetical protein
LAARVSDNLPPSFVEHPEASNRWQNLYLLVRNVDTNERTLAGIAGVSRLKQDTILLGFSLVEDCQKRGIGSEDWSADGFTRLT